MGTADTEFGNMITSVLTIVNNYVIRGLIIIGAVVVAIMFLINWIKYTKAEDGEPKTKAKKALIGTGIGCVGLIASIWLVPTVIDLLIQIMPIGNIEDPTACVGNITTLATVADNAALVA